MRPLKVRHIGFFQKIITVIAVMVLLSVIIITAFSRFASMRMLEDSRRVACEQAVTSIDLSFKQRFSDNLSMLEQIYKNQGLCEWLSAFFYDDFMFPEGGYEMKLFIDELERITDRYTNLEGILFYNGSMTYYYNINLGIFTVHELLGTLCAENKNEPIFSVSNADIFYKNAPRPMLVMMNTYMYGFRSITDGRMGFVYKTDFLDNAFSDYGWQKRRLFVFGRTERLIYSTDRDMGINKNITDMKNQIVADKDSLQLWFDNQGELTYLVESTGMGLDDNAWYLTDTVYLMATGCIILVCTAFLFITRITKHKIAGINRAMNTVVSSNLNYRIPLDQSDDEFSSIAVSFNKMCDNLQGYIERVIVYELKQRSAELKALERQIDPHFLYNSLEIVRSGLEIEGHSDSAVMLESLISLFRRTIKGKRVVTVGEELTYSRAYLDIFLARYAGFLTAEWVLDPGVNEYGTISGILQPILENYVLYGYNPNKDDNVITVKANLTDSCVMFEVSDNGVGITEEKLREIRDKLDCADSDDTSSIGLVNVHIRIRLLFGEAYGLSVENKQGMTRFNICLPRKSTEDIRKLLQINQKEEQDDKA